MYTHVHCNTLNCYVGPTYFAFAYLSRCLCVICSPNVDIVNLFCCRESSQLEKKRGEETCVIHQRGFTLNALEMEVLDAVYHHFQTRLYRGQKEVDRMRYVLVGTCMILLL